MPAVSFIDPVSCPQIISPPQNGWVKIDKNDLYYLLYKIKLGQFNSSLSVGGSQALNFSLGLPIITGYIQFVNSGLGPIMPESDIWNSYTDYCSSYKENKFACGPAYNLLQLYAENLTFSPSFDFSNVSDLPNYPVSDISNSCSISVDVTLDNVTFEIYYQVAQDSDSNYYINYTFNFYVEYLGNFLGADLVGGDTGVSASGVITNGFTITLPSKTISYDLYWYNSNLTDSVTTSVNLSVLEEWDYS